MPRKFWRPARRMIPIRSRTPDAACMEAQLGRAEHWPLETSLLSTDWEDVGMAAMLWVRGCPETARYAMAYLHLDLAGRGLTRCVVELGLRRSQMWSFRESLPSGLERADPTLSRRLVQVARARGERTGAADPEEWPQASRLLGAVTVAHPIPDFAMVGSPERPVSGPARVLWTGRRVAEA